RYGPRRDRDRRRARPVARRGAGRVTRSASDDVRERIRRIEGGGMRTFADSAATVWARAEGAHLWDEDGRRYLDLYAGFAVANVGHCHPRVTAAIREQAGLLT